MKKLLVFFAVLLTAATMICGCSDLSGPDGTSSGKVDGSSAGGTVTDGYDPDYDPAFEDLDIEFGRIYTHSEYYSKYTALCGYRNRKETVLDRYFEEDVESGRIPLTLTFRCNGEDYELQLDREEKYGLFGNIAAPTVTYFDPEELGDIVVVDLETFGEKWFNARLIGNANQTPVSTLGKKSEEELLAIANEWFEPFKEAWGLREGEYSVYCGVKNSERRHVDVSAKEYWYAWVYNNIHSNNSQLADLWIDEYGIISYQFASDQYLLDEEFLASIPEIDYGRILQDVQRFRAEGCDCELSSINTRLISMEYNGREIAILFITIVPDQRAPETHVHWDYEDPLAMFLRVKK